jgi:hypothetical protein
MPATITGKPIIAMTMPRMGIASSATRITKNTRLIAIQTPGLRVKDDQPVSARPGWQPGRWRGRGWRASW